MNGENVLSWLDDAIRSREQTAFDALNRERGADWQANGESVQVAGGFDPDSDVFKETVVFGQGSPTAEQAHHIAANDPAAVLRRCAADRKILDGLWDLSQLSAAPGQPIGIVEQMALDAIRSTLQLLASGYGWTGGTR